jgi:hypothetical protein
MPQQNPAMIDAGVTQMILAQSLDMIQATGPAFTPTFSATVPVQMVTQLRPVGLIKRLYVEVSGRIKPTTNNSALTTLGLANILSNVTLYDLANNIRHNTTGWHLHMIASARRQYPFASCMQTNDVCGFGDNFRVNGVYNAAAGMAKNNRMAPGATLVAGQIYPFNFMYEIPLAYSDKDLHGSIYANTTSANVQLSMTLNPNFIVTSAASAAGDPTLAVVQDAQTTGATTCLLDQLTFTVYQQYLDQLPADKNGNVILPPLSMSTAYMLNTTFYAGLAAAQGQPISYANQRNFLSTIVIYDNTRVLNINDSALDINLFQLQTANLTNILQYDEQIAALLTRNKLWVDVPPGVYYFDHRLKPISTIQYGNQQLVVTPKVVTDSTAQLLVGFEALAPIGSALTGGSLKAA